MSERARIRQENGEILLEAKQLVVELTCIQAERTRIQAELELLRQRRGLTLAQVSRFGSCLYRFQDLEVEKAMLEEKVLRLHRRALRLNEESKALGRGETEWTS